MCINIILNTYLFVLQRSYTCCLFIEDKLVVWLPQGKQVCLVERSSSLFVCLYEVEEGFVCCAKHKRSTFVTFTSASYPLACAKVTDYMSVSTNLTPLFKPSRRLYNLKEYSYYAFYKQIQYRAFKEVLEVSQIQKLF